MNNLSNSVGKTGINQRPDVLAVQALLNAKMSKPFVPLKTDGVAGIKTITAISDYQRRVMSMQNPDGLIVPHGPTWKSLSGSVNPAHAAAVHTQQQNGPASALVNNPAVRAMLDTLGYSEGTGDEYGTVVHGTVIQAPNPKDVGRKNVVVTDFSDHPRMLVQVGAHLKSTAAGRYQFLVKTWDELGMPNFSKESQDEACVKLFQRRNMIAPLLQGDFDTAIQRGSLEWASLPDSEKNGHSHYGGQSARTLAQLRAKFTSSFGLYAKS